MSTWASLAVARDDLRRFLNDGATDRPVKNKQVVGLIDGANRVFQTYEDRIIEGSLFVSVNFAELPSVQVTTNDALMGIFTLATAPSPQSIVRARYYFQYFIDRELDEAMQLAAGEIVESDDITLIGPGLKNSALNYGGHFAYMKQAIRWAQRKSSQFLLEEEPLESETQGRSNLFRQLAQDFVKEGERMRDDFYKRHGRRNAPSFTVFKPRVPSIAPRR